MTDQDSPGCCQLPELGGLYRTMIEQSRDGIAITQDGFFRYVNASFCEMVGYSSYELLDMPGADLLAPADKERMMGQHFRRMAGSKVPTLDTTALVRKDGTEVVIELSATSIQYEGRAASFISARNITDRVKMQADLEKSEQRFRELSDFLPQTVYELDTEGRLVYMNQAGKAAFGMDDDYVGTPSGNGLIPEDRVRLAENVRSAMLQKETRITDEYTALRNDGTTFPIMIYGTPMFQDGKLIGSRGLIIDISSRKAMEEELRKAHKRLEEINQLLEEKIDERTRELTETNTLLLKVQKENLQTRFDVLKQQVNPHFLFNSLNVLTSLIRIEPDLAEKFTEQLAKVYRYVLENRDNELVPLSTELDFLDAYVFLLNIRFMDKLKVIIDIDEDRKSAGVIPLAIQLLIENAIKHNSMSKKSPLVIDIFVDDRCNLNVVNNLQEREARITSTGIGLKNIENRYRLLNSSETEFMKTETQFIARIPLICDPAKTR
jgi:PAS domain S-box-containing protein